MESLWLFRMDDGISEATGSRQIEEAAETRQTGKSVGEKARCDSFVSEKERSHAGRDVVAKTASNLGNMGGSDSVHDSEIHSTTKTVNDQPMGTLDEHKGKELEAKGRKNARHITANDLMRLLRMQEYRCALTGDTLTPSNCSLDHIEPFSRHEGNHVLDNLQLVTDAVNRAKGTMNNREFIDMCLKVAAMYR